MNKLTSQFKSFYKITEFAQELDIHPNTVRRMIKTGKILAFKLNEGKSVYRIPASEIERMALFDLQKVVKNMADKEKK